MLAAGLRLASPAPQPAAPVVALIGVDEDPAGPPFSSLRLGEIRRRSDSLILIAPTPGGARALWLPRDTLVAMPSGQTDILGHALRRGGIDWLDRVLQENFGLRPQAHVVLDFAGFSRLVDTLGGVDLDGHHLGGPQVLQRVRAREGDPFGDIGRIGRQMTVGRAIVQSVRAAGPLALLRVALATSSAVRTDLPMPLAARLAWQVAGGGLRMAMLPGAPEGPRFRAAHSAPAFARAFLMSDRSSRAPSAAGSRWGKAIALSSSGPERPCGV